MLAAQIFALTLFDNKRNLKKFTEYVLKIYVVLNVVFYNEQNEEEEETNSSKVWSFWRINSQSFIRQIILLLLLTYVTPYGLELPPPGFGAMP